MNLKQILKTVVKAVMTVVAIRGANAQEDSNFEYMTSVVCPHQEPYKLEPISGRYFFDRGLWWENATSIIDGVEWQMVDSFSNAIPLISPQMNYTLNRYARHTYAERLQRTHFSQTNMELIDRYPADTQSRYASLTSEIRCTYQNLPKDREKLGLSRFTLAAKPHAIYHKFNHHDGDKCFVHTSENLYGVVHYLCSTPYPELCEVKASFKRFPKKAKPAFFKTASPTPTPTATPTIKSSACLML